ncbi:DUF1048 domain-containing protein [Actinocatenispora sera]|nr:DUF1048 domain-containing protein [Actinocatenispora sera]
MNFWEKVTGSAISREWKGFEARAAELPADYQAGWRQVRSGLTTYADFSGRNLTPILDGALGLLEESAAEGQSVGEVLGDDVAGFCAALAGGAGARNYRDRWRDQLNRNIARKLGQMGG